MGVTVDHSFDGLHTRRRIATERARCGLARHCDFHGVSQQLIFARVFGNYAADLVQDGVLAGEIYDRGVFTPHDGGALAITK